MSCVHEVQSTALPVATRIKTMNFILDTSYFIPTSCPNTVTLHVEVAVGQLNSLWDGISGALLIVRQSWKEILIDTESLAGGSNPR